MVNRLNTILGTEWNATIITKPDFVELTVDTMEFYDIGIGSRKIEREDELKGIMSRQYFSSESHNAFHVEVVHTTQANADLLIDGIEEAAATYDPAATEVIIEWSSNIPLEIWNNQRYKYTFIVFLKKAGISAY